MEFEKLKRLYKITDKSFGHSLYEIENKEKELSIKLPKLLVDFYHQFGKNIIVTSDQSLRNLNELWIDNKGYLELYLDEQTGNRWSIKPREENNKLYFKPLKKNWILEQTLIKDFLLSQLYWSACTRSEFYAIGNTNDMLIGTLLKEKVLTKITVESEFKNVKFYQKSSNDIIGINNNTIFLGSNNKQEFKELISLFGDNWFVNSTENQVMPNFDKRKMNKEH